MKYASCHSGVTAPDPSRLTCPLPAGVCTPAHAGSLSYAGSRLRFASPIG